MSLFRYSRRRFLAMASAAGLAIGQKRLFAQSETDPTYLHSTSRSFPASAGETRLTFTTESDGIGASTSLTKASVELTVPFGQFESGFITEVRWEGARGAKGPYRDVAIRRLENDWTDEESARIKLAFDLVNEDGNWFAPDDMGHVMILARSVGVIREETEALFEREQPLLEKLLSDSVREKGALGAGYYRMVLGEIQLMGADPQAAPLSRLKVSESAAITEDSSFVHRGTRTEQTLRFEPFSRTKSIDLLLNRVQGGKFERTALLRSIPVDSIGAAFAALSEEMKTHQRAYASGEAKVKETAACTVSTAVCEVIGLPDDCFELRTLRRFRDEYMRSEEVEEYRSWSARLLGSPFFTTKPGLAALGRFYFKTILPSVALCLLGLNDRVYRCYRRGVSRLDEEMLKQSASVTG